MIRPEFPSNLTLLVGHVKDDPIFGRNPRPQRARINVEVPSPFEGSFTVSMEVHPGICGYQEIWRELFPGDKVEFKGQLIAQDLQDLPREMANHDTTTVIYRDAVFQPHMMQLETMEDWALGAESRLDGVVMDAPIFFRHPRFSDVEMARTRLSVANLPNVGNFMPNLNLSTAVMVAIPTNHPDMEWLLRVGNRLQVSARLDRMLLASNSPYVRDRLNALEREWAEEMERLKSDSYALRAGLRRHQQRMRRLGSVPRTIAIVTKVAAYPEAQKLDRDAAMAMRRQERIQHAQRRRHQGGHSGARG